MNFQRSGNIFESRIFRFLFRITVLFLFSVLFKSFDLTFVEGFGTQPVRSAVFSTVFVAYGYLVWIGAIGLTGLIERHTKGQFATVRLWKLVGSLFLYGLLAAFFFGFTYAGSDIILFGRYEAWDSFKRLSYELNIGIFLFYLLILAFNGIIFYYRQWNEYQIKTERLMRENIQARYETLMNQIEPHFFFNSLSVLTNLVYKNPDLSATYITRLAQCYRYILDKKMENLITIASELDFLKSYSFLIQVRHQNSIIFDLDIPEEIQQKRMVPPASLQMLIENAIKHNCFSVAKPLHIRIRFEEGFLIVSNNLDKRASVPDSTGTGLDNIRKRYELNGSAGITVLQEAGQFMVKLPTFLKHGHPHF
ncbi:sensor histidine kinase [Parapedobacter tibetensis]|uniref:sensor histidine kinase n=1 Tax=Parapedobacter tibetensis TaxID=2972951 RepID=UPI00214D4ECF|nr:histidine kinase [Parapedobacter tibetensis]